jgi:hypothetical protein
LEGIGHSDTIGIDNSRTVGRLHAKSRSGIGKPVRTLSRIALRQNQVKVHTARTAVEAELARLRLDSTRTPQASRAQSPSLFPGPRQCRRENRRDLDAAQIPRRKDEHSVRTGSMPSDLSMKNTVPSGGFAADCFFDGTGLQIEVLREIRDGIPGLVSFVDGWNRYAGAGDHRSAKGN